MEENFILTYLCRFDEYGTRGETYDTAGMSKEEKQSKLDSGFIEITEEEWHYLVGNKGQGDNNTGYIYDVAAKKVKSAPPAPEPTAEEEAEQKKAQLDASYEANKKELLSQYAEAVAYNDTDTAKAVQEQLTALDTQYDADYKAAEEGSK